MSNFIRMFHIRLLNHLESRGYSKIGLYAMYSFTIVYSIGIAIMLGFIIFNVFIYFALMLVLSAIYFGIKRLVEKRRA